jgi:WD40 repeat protein
MERDDGGTSQVCNPPMVHSLAWSPSGRLLAAGLGDGTCSILQVDHRNIAQVARLRDGHDASLATVVFPNWKSDGSNHVLAQDRLLVSAGTDGAILLWDLGTAVAGDGAVDPKIMFRESAVSLESAMDQASLNEHASPRIIFGIPHEEKPNWMVCSSNTNLTLPSTFFVADTTNDITAYIIPVR